MRTRVKSKARKKPTSLISTSNFRVTQEQLAVRWLDGLAEVSCVRGFQHMGLDQIPKKT